MNAPMIELSKQDEVVWEEQGSKISYPAVNSGYCKIALNGFRGERNPLDGVKVVEELVVFERAKYESSFWSWEENEYDSKMKNLSW
jgi:hypothetical protein